MTPSTVSSESVLVTIILITLAIGLPVVMVLLIRFLWDRNLNLGRSKDLDKLIWQLHRVASALEHHMNLSFPPVQPSKALAPSATGGISNRLADYAAALWRGAMVV